MVRSLTETGRPRLIWRDAPPFVPTMRPAADAARERGLEPSRAAALVAVRRTAWNAMWAHARSSPVEVGGVLLGAVTRDPVTGRHTIDVTDFVAARGALESSTYFKLTPAAWEHIAQARARLQSDLPIVGWCHTHPDLGVFFSATDRATQRAFFAEPWNVGLVIDPVRDELAVFLGGDATRLPIEAIQVYDAFPSVETPKAWSSPASIVASSRPGPAPRRVLAAALALLLAVFWLLRRRRG